MGLDAYVSCRCWQDGIATPAPVPVHWDDEAQCVEPVNADEVGMTLDEGTAMWIAFGEWEDNACAHPGMRAASEWIQNWSGVAQFASFLIEHEDLAPVLTYEWLKRKGNGGGILFQITPLIWRELDQLMTLVVSSEPDEFERWFQTDTIEKLRRLCTAAFETRNHIV